MSVFSFKQVVHMDGSEANDPLDVTTGTCPSMLSKKTDPFEKRAGQELTWSGVGFKTKGPDARTILEDVSGFVLPGKLTALMGHSGSGKTTLTKILCGFLKTSSEGKVTHTIKLDGNKFDPSSSSTRHTIAYVAQRDTLNPHSTPRECIRFSARLRLPRTIANEEIEVLTSRILSKLNLNDVADCCIGGDMFGGLSGGEMRRVSLGIELVVRPSVLIVDEATSGLDSHNAMTVVEVLNKVAACGFSVLCTVHQPPSRMLSMFDHLILLKSGRCMYNGPITSISTYCSGRGFPVPSNYNPAEWIMNVSELHTTIEDMKNNPDVSVHFGKGESVLVNTKFSVSHKMDEKHMGLSTAGETVLLFKRDALHMFRDRKKLLYRFPLIGGGSVLIALAFLSAGDSVIGDDLEFLTHVSALFCVLMVTIVIVTKTFFEYIVERPAVVREVFTGHYNLYSYTVSRFMIDSFICTAETLVFLLPVYFGIEFQASFFILFIILLSACMVSCSVGVAVALCAKDPRTANEFIPAIILPQTLFNGFLVSLSSIPFYVRWISYGMPTTYLFRLALYYEFESCQYYTTKKDQYFGECVDLLLDLNKKNLFGEYPGNSSLTLAQAGSYIGSKDVLEYLGFASREKEHPTSNTIKFCKEKGRSIFQLNDAGEGYCDLTFGAPYHSAPNPKFTSLDGTNMVQVVLGHKINVTFPPGDADGKKAEIHDTLYIPTKFFEDLYTVALNSTKMATHTCSIMEKYCPDVYDFNDFIDQHDCSRQLDALPIVEPNDSGLNTIDSNTTGCRHLHSSLAVLDPKLHCPHISLKPLVDIRGKTKCSISANFSITEMFTDDDFSLFQRVATENNLDPSAQSQPTSEDKLPSCSGEDNFNKDDVLKGIELPSNYSCKSYLARHDASGDLNVSYWTILWSFIIGLRFLSIFFLKKRISSQV